MDRNGSSGPLAYYDVGIICVDGRILNRRYREILLPELRHVCSLPGVSRALLPGCHDGSANWRLVRRVFGLGARLDLKPSKSIAIFEHLSCGDYRLANCDDKESHLANVQVLARCLLDDTKLQSYGLTIVHRFLIDYAKQTLTFLGADQLELAVG